MRCGNALPPGISARGSRGPGRKWGPSHPSAELVVVVVVERRGQAVRQVGIRRRQLRRVAVAVELVLREERVRLVHRSRRCSALPRPGADVQVGGE